MNDFELVKKSTGSYAFIGVIDKKTVTNIWQERHQLVAKNNTIILDLTKITLCDSAGLALLICFQSEAAKSGYQFSFLNIPTQLKQLVELSHLQHILNAGQGL